MPALIFDCDGVLADTERDGHLPSYNQTFVEFGLPVTWTIEGYATQLAFSGGKERLQHMLSPAFLRATGLPDDPVALADLVNRWHRRKTEIYTQRVAAGLLTGRAGVARLAAEARAAGWALAVASASAEPAVRAVLTHVVGSAQAASFTVLAGDIVPAKKPAPDIYQLALERLGVDPGEALAIEDSRLGLLAAVGAGIRCIITPSSYTRAECFDEATLVVSSLGDPGEPLEVIANHSRAIPGPLLTLADLAACLQG
jgi:HAD superfamily hydrolase (TIGR01509 family)